MKVKSALLGLAAASGGLLMSANVASADGYSAPARYVPAPTWTGCYIGIEGGWAWGHSEPKRLDINTTSTPVTVTTTSFAAYNMDGGLIGGTAGCNLKWRVGLAYGAGAEWKFDRNWSAKIEYLHIDFENQQYLTPSVVGFQNRGGGVSVDDDIVRVGINYKFDRREVVPLK